MSSNCGSRHRLSALSVPHPLPQGFVRNAPACRQFIGWRQTLQRPTGHRLPERPRLGSARYGHIQGRRGRPIWIGRQRANGDRPRWHRTRIGRTERHLRGQILCRRSRGSRLLARRPGRRRHWLLIRSPRHARPWPRRRRTGGHIGCSITIRHGQAVQRRRGGQGFTV